jgi:holo-[acyl-carrier protein] synthase
MIIGVGIDVVQVSRIRKAMQNSRFLERILTPDEMKLELTPLRVASRWAAKEAIYKAIGGGVHWQDMSILNDVSRAPRIVWTGDSPLQEGQKVHLSLSHEQSVAVAVAILECFKLPQS